MIVWPNGLGGNEPSLSWLFSPPSTNLAERLATLEPARITVGPVKVRDVSSRVIVNV